MNPLRKGSGLGESQTIEKLAQRNTNRTSEFGKDPVGRKKRNNAPRFTDEDFAALARLTEGALCSASALLERLKNLQPNDPSLVEIGDLLKRAKTSFGEFKTRTQVFATGVTP